MNLLFWNLQKKPNEKHIANCLIENNIDIALFSEYQNNDFKKLCSKSLNAYKWEEGNGGCNKITLLCKVPINVTIKREQDRYVLYEINKTNFHFIICGTHLQSRTHSDPAKRINTIGRLVNDIKNLEDSIKCHTTIIIGDFNANPYDPELLQMDAFHAVLFKDVIKKSETRTVNGQSYRRFYNPIIHFLSEDTKMYGSFYYSNDSSTPVWHCLDQILVSKSLVESISNVKYLKNIKNINLINKVRPNAKISDHLPLFAEIKEK